MMEWWKEEILRKWLVESAPEILAEYEASVGEIADSYFHSLSYWVERHHPEVFERIAEIETSCSQKASDVIRELQELVEKYGDLPVFAGAWLEFPIDAFGSMILLKDEELKKKVSGDGFVLERYPKRFTLNTPHL